MEEPRDARGPVIPQLFLDMQNVVLDFPTIEPDYICTTRRHLFGQCLDKVLRLEHHRIPSIC